jgi:hypothetical protein
MRIANRKAKADREFGLNALESFVNIGVTPEDWSRFHLKFPKFFPTDLSQWLYLNGEDWHRKFPHHPEQSGLKPALLFYRDCLRRVWRRDDEQGTHLKLLLGFEQEVKDRHLLQTPMLPGMPYEGKRGKLKLGILIPGQPLDRDRQTTFAGLPPGKPVVNGTTGEITWEFGCTVQQSVYELMQTRWRAKVCPECKKYFLADNTRQTYCSSTCFGEMKRKRSLEYWNRKGSFARAKRRIRGRAFCS